MPLKPSQNACSARSRFATLTCGHGAPLSGGSVFTNGYGCSATLSMIGFLRPLLRYASPTALMKRTGEIVFRAEPGRSSPFGDTAMPITLMSGRTAFSAS